TTDRTGRDHPSVPEEAGPPSTCGGAAARARERHRRVGDRRIRGRDRPVTCSGRIRLPCRPEAPSLYPDRRMEGPRFDVVVVGGGPAGLSAARVVAEAGSRVLVVEKDPEVGEPVRTTGGTWIADMAEHG